MRGMTFTLGLLMLAGCAQVAWEPPVGVEATADQARELQAHCKLVSMRYDGGDSPFALGGDLVSQWNSIQRGDQAFTACMEEQGWRLVRVNGGN